MGAVHPPCVCLRIHLEFASVGEEGNLEPAHAHPCTCTHTHTHVHRLTSLPSVSLYLFPPSLTLLLFTVLLSLFLLLKFYLSGSLLISALPFSPPFHLPPSLLLIVIPSSKVASLHSPP